MYHPVQSMARSTHMELLVDGHTSGHTRPRCYMNVSLKALLFPAPLRPFRDFSVCGCAVGLVVAGLVVTTLSTFGSLVLQGYLGVNTTGPGRFLVREKTNMKNMYTR